jgi:hypothetical protein
MVKPKLVKDKTKSVAPVLEFAKDLNPNPKITPLPKRQLGTGRHLIEISDTLFDDDLYN